MERGGCFGLSLCKAADLVMCCSGVPQDWSTSIRYCGLLICCFWDPKVRSELVEQLVSGTITVTRYTWRCNLIWYPGDSPVNKNNMYIVFNTIYTTFVLDPGPVCLMLCRSFISFQKKGWNFNSWMITEASRSYLWKELSLTSSLADSWPGLQSS